MRLVLWLIVMLFYVVTLRGQSVLWYANTAPQADDAFVRFSCGFSHFSQGPGGTGVTWDFSRLASISADTITYSACAGTASCDSFPGTAIVAVANGSHDFYAADTSSFALAGEGLSGGNSYYSQPEAKIMFPASYGVANGKSFSYSRPATSWYGYGVDSFFVDGYGTLMLPTGTYNNVLRIHTISIGADSNFYSSTALVDSARYDVYSWYSPGFHAPLLSMYYDFAGLSGVPELAQIFFFARSTEKVNGVTADFDVTIYPNPATSQVSVRFYSSCVQDVGVSILDISGGEEMASSCKRLVMGVNEVILNVNELPPGIYLLRIQYADNYVMKKLVIR